MNRRTLLATAAGFTGCARRPAASGCAALTGQTIRWVVPYPPGGGYDVFSRLFSVPFEKALGAEIIIQNEPGAGGLVGAARIRDAAPNGLTLGILNAAGLLVGSLLADAKAPSPVRDFTVLGRLSRSWSLLATSPKTGLRTMEDLIARQKEKPLLCGITGPASGTFLSCAVAADLLGLRTEYIPGYGGSREEMLAAMRGEVDISSASFETLQPALESGDLHPLVFLADRPPSSHPALAGCAQLGGPDGWAARRASASRRTPEQAVQDAQTLVDLIGAGIIAVAPRQLPAELTACLRARFLDAARSPAFAQAVKTARRTLDVADGAQAQATLESAESRISRFAPIVQAAAQRMRR